jgi:transposase
MPESSSQKIARLEQENARLNATITALNETLSELREQLKQAQEGNSELRTLLAALQVKLDALLEQKRKRNRKDFGPHTETFNPRPAPAAAEPRPEQAEPKPKNATHKKNIHLQKLPTRPIEHKVPPELTTCPDCNVETVFVRDEITYQLEKLLNTLERLEHRQEVRACPKCKHHVVRAEKPCAPNPGGLPGPNLLATTIVEKCDDGLPQYRQSKRAQREKGIIPRSTLCDWFQAGSFTIEPLYERLKHEALQSYVIQTDDCPVKIQNRKARGTMRKGKMTVYRGDAKHPVIFFDFSPDLSFKQNQEMLRDFSGFVQADAAAGFDALFVDGTKTEVGCSAHSRRKFFELCDEVVALYGKLYDIERRIKDQSPIQRLAVRRRLSKPVTHSLHHLLQQLRQTLNPKHPLMSGVEYTLKHWVALHRFLGDPMLEIDNNPAERAIKDFVISRKNFLFVGSDAGGKAMAINLSIVATCKRNGINPVEYLADVFARINTMKTSQLDELLPWRWAESRKERQTKAST